MKQALHVSWEEIQQKSKELARLLLELGPWRGIVGVSRSGLVPASIIAMELDILLVDTVCISSYDHQTQREAKVLKTPSSTVLNDGKEWIIIDDLVDTGQTAQVLRRLLPKAKFATLYAKEMGKPHVDYYITDVPQTSWIYFPWDAEPVMPNKL